MKSLASIAVLVLSTSLASAQPSPDQPHRRHDPNKALALSIAGTAVPLVMAAVGSVILYEGSAWGETVGGIAYTNQQAEALHDPAGVLVGLALVGGLFGPSLGHTYGEHRLATTGFRLRLIALAGAAAGVIPFIAAELGGGDAAAATFFTMEGLAAATFLTGAAIDIATARSATRRFNDRQRDFSMTLAPLVVRTPEHATATGLAVVGRF